MKDVVDAALVQFVPRSLEPVANLDAMVAAVRRTVREQPTDLVIFPEMATTGYLPPSYSEEFARLLTRTADRVPGPATDALSSVAAETGAHVVAGVTERGPEGDLFNSLVLVTPNGEIAGVHRKVHLFSTEPYYFTPGDRFDVLPTSLGRIGLSVCYDSKFPEASRSQALAGAEILICVFAYADDPGVPPDILTHRAVVRAWENQVYYLVSNRLGEEYQIQYVGRSVAADPYGRILTGAHGAGDPVVRARLTQQVIGAVRGAAVGPADRRPDVYGDPAPAAVGRRVRASDPAGAAHDIHRETA